MIFGNDEIIHLDGATYIRVARLADLKDRILEKVFELNNIKDLTKRNQHFNECGEILHDFVDEIREESYKENYEYLSKLNGS